MYKKLLPLLIIVIAIVLLFGIFSFFNFLLEKSEDELIQKIGSIELPKKYKNTDTTDVSLIDIITNTDFSVAYSISHQPFENQLSMNEALQISKSTIMEFIQNGIILNANDIENRIENEKNYSLSLHTRIDNINPLYSLWYIKYDDDKLHIYIYLNAITGNILKLLVIEDDLENSKQNLNIKSQEEILNLYVEYLKLEDLKTDLSVYNLYDETYATCKLKNTNMYLTTSSYILNEKNYYLSISFTNDTQVFNN